MPTSSFVFRLAAVAIALAVSHSAIAAAPAPRYGVFVYANFCVSQQSGDLYGNRITLLRSPDATSLFFEYTDGSTHGVVATDLKLDTPHDAITFVVQTEHEPPSALTGNIAPDGQSLTLRGIPFAGPAPQTLLRLTNFATPARNCKK